MTHTLIRAALLFGLTAPLSIAGDATKETQVRELMALTGAADMGKQTMDAMMAQFEQSMVPKEFAEKFKAKARPDDLVDMVVPIYVDLLDEQTLQAAIQFYKTPEGRKLIAAMPEINQRAMAAGQAWGEKLGMEVAAEMGLGQ